MINERLLRPNFDVADHDGSPCRLGHRTIDPRFQRIGRRQATPDVESVGGKKEQVGAQVSQRFLGQWPDQGERILTQGPACQNHLNSRPNPQQRFVALVIIVSPRTWRQLRAMAAVVVPESRMITCPGRIIRTAASAILSFSCL